MKVIADLEVHSKYARAVSSSMDVPTIGQWADKKGIGLVGTGDFTHPMWLRELETNLEEDGQGIYKLRPKFQMSKSKLKTRFLLTSEVSCIYSHKDKGRRVHLMVFMSSFESVKKFNKKLTELGANLFSDGRPIMGLSLYQVTQVALESDPSALIIPAHVWTPWFGFYGTMSGYDSLNEAFDDLEKHIPAIETGLSSDPAMNWKVGELGSRRIVSFGDAHSPQKLGREATVFELKKMTFENLRYAIWGEGEENKILYTIEFYPEEGKYHHTGHRKCKVAYSPKEAKKKGMSCPVCGKTLTMGVMSRVESLATYDVETSSKSNKLGVRFVKDKEDEKPPYVMLVPLAEIISEIKGVGVGTKTVMSEYERLINSFDSEFSLLLHASIDEIKKEGGDILAEAISRVRSGDIVIKPGYDGVFGQVKIWKGKKEETERTIDQGALF